MVARINTSKNISRALNYNEQKVQQGKAELLSSEGFLKEANQMNFHDKINRFESLISLNERTQTNTLHVSLNFDPSEKISNEKMVDIADCYMQKIGFGNQPYLVYRHHDSGHPHIHIVSTNIQNDGRRISMHNMGRNQSENARKEIEKTFGLIKADDRKKANTENLKSIDARKVVYGKSATRTAIANVLGGVINQYKFTSLPELNAVLQLYNITADRGQEGSRIYKHNGLTFRILDEQGNKVGIPQKASSFSMKPTLANLQQKFAENEVLRSPHRKRIQTEIAWTLNKQPDSIAAFTKALEKENIRTVLRIGKQGSIYGITYVDHKTKSVFNGSDLGKEYSAKAILEKCGQQKELLTERNANLNMAIEQKNGPPGDQKHDLNKEQRDAVQHQQASKQNLPLADYLPSQLKPRKKKKRKRMSM